jgi:hypothetical protein
VRLRTILAAFAAFAVLTLTGVYLVTRNVGGLPLRLPTANACVVTGSGDPVSLDPEQMANAATISAAGIRRGVPRRAIVVALATAWQESKLSNLSGGDRDSIGLFQQRPSQDWGTPEQIADPRYAAGEFYTALLKVRGWQQMRVTEAAQAVQRSAHPEAYERWAAPSDVLASALTGETVGAVGCTVSSDPPRRGDAAAQAIVAGLKLDWGDVNSAPHTTGVSVTVRNGKMGWQYAHWLVAHATDQGIRRVRFGTQEWTAKAGTWASTSGDATAGSGNTVLAEVQAA